MQLARRVWRSTLVMGLGLSLSAAVYAQQGPSALNVSGALYNPDGSAVTAPTVNFRLEIWDQANTCVLYSELHNNQDLITTRGAFSLILGGGTSPQNFIAGTTALDARVFNNPGAIAPFAGCTTPPSLTVGQSRNVHIYYDLGSGFKQLTPEVPIVAAAYAIVAESLQGKTADQFLQVADNGSTSLSQANTEYAFSMINWPKLKALIDGTSTLYQGGTPTAPVDYNNQRLINVADPTALQDAATKNYVDTMFTGKPLDLTGISPMTGDGRTILWDSANNRWTTGFQTATGTAGGDLTGTYPNPTIASGVVDTLKIADNSITSAKLNTVGIGRNRLVMTDPLSGANLQFATCAANEILKYDVSSGWTCATVTSLAPVTSVAGRTGDVVLNAGDIANLGTAALYNYGTAANEILRLDASARVPAVDGSLLTGVNAVKLQSRDVASTAPTSGQVLGWNASTSKWEPVTAAVGSVTEIQTGVGLLGGPITTTGTLSVDVGSGALKIVQENANAQIAQIPGAVGTPSFSFVGDTNTGLTSTGADQLALVTNGNAALTVLADGRVGIGGASPQAALDINVTGSTSAVVLPRDTTANRPGLNVANGMVRYNTSTNKFEAYENGSWINMIGGAAANVSLSGITAATAVNTIDNGTFAQTWNWSTATTQTPLSINADALTTGSALSLSSSSAGLNSTNGILNVANTGGATNGLVARIQSNSTAGSGLNVLANGRVGIGTTAPSSTLTLSSTNANSGGLRFESTVGTVGRGVIFSQGTDSLAIQKLSAGGSLNVLNSAGTAEFSVFSDGKVGIGQSAPTAQLDVLAATDAAAQFTRFGTSGNRRSIVTFNKSGGAAVGDYTSVANNALLGEFYFAGSNGTTFVPGARIFTTVEGTPDTTSVPTAISFSTANTGAAPLERLRISSSGNVGVGTVTPVAGLDVNITGTNSAVVLPRDTTANRPGLNVANGMVRYNTSTNKFEAYENGAWINMIGGAATNVSLSGITAATAVNTIDNLNFAQTWNWSSATTQSPLSINANSLTTGSALSVTTSSASLSSTNGLLNVANTGTATNGIIARVQSNAAAGSGLTVLANGNIGVGTTNPTQLLEIVGSTPIIKLTDSAGPISALINGGSGNLFLSTASTARNFVFNGGSSEVMRISGTGNVGIGTATPRSTLDVSSTGSNSAIVIPRDTTANRPGLNVANGMVRYNTSTNKFEAYENGAWINMIGGAAANVSLSGITAATAVNTIDNANFAQTWNWSTATTQTPLSINSDALTTGSALSLSSASPALNSTNGILNIVNSGTSTNGVIARIQSNASAGSGFTVLANGNVGIGTATPNNSLSVTASQDASTAVSVNNPSSGGSAAGGFGGSSDVAAFSLYAYSSGTVASTYRRPNGVALVTSAASTGGIALAARSTTGIISLHTGGNTERMRVESTGNVGIGTSTPQAVLDLASTGTNSAVVLPRDTTANRPGLNVANGMVRYNTSTNKFEAYENGAWINMIGGSAANVSLNGITAATAVNTIDNLNFAQTWNWSTATTQTPFAISANALTSGTALSVTTSSTTLSSVNGLLNVANTGTGTSGIIARVQSNSAAGSGLTVLANGSVGVGTSAPSSTLDVRGPASVGPGTGAPDQSPILTLSTDRSWMFEQSGTGSSAALALRPATDAKAFKIISQDRTKTPFSVYSSIASGYTSVILAGDGGLVGVGTTSPAAVLDIAATGSTSAVVLPRDTTANRPGLNVANGMVRYNTSTNKFEAYENGAWINMIGGSAANVSLSGITAATAVNTIDNANFAQTWNWSTATTQSPLSINANSLTTGSALNLTTSSVSLSSTNGLLNIANTGTSTSGMIARVQSNATAGSGLTVLANGNVGVGNAAPALPLEVAGAGRFTVNSTSTGTVPLTVTQSGAGDNGINFLISGVRRTTIGLDSADSYKLKFATTTGTPSFATDTKMTVDTAGNVGIGTSSPLARLDVSVTGTNSAVILPRDTTANRPGLNVANGMVRYNTTTNKFEAYENGSWINMIGGSAANVSLSGITAATAVNSIDNLNFAQTWNWSTATTQDPVSFTANSLTTGSLLNLTTSSASLNSTSGLLYVANTGTSANGILARFKSSPTAGSGLSVLTNGRVGIGTAAPVAALHVTNGGSSGKSFSNNTGLLIENDGNSGAFKALEVSTAGAPDAFSVLNNGTVNIGANSSTSSLLTISPSTSSQGVIRFTTDADANYLQSGLVLTPGSVKDFRIGKYASTTGWINISGATGNVGIGTTSPTSILDVASTGTNSALVLPRDTTANRPGLNVVNGMVRYNTTTNKFEAFENGAWINMIGGSAGSVSLSGITAATASNTIDNLNFAQTWNWSTATTQTPLAVNANTLTTGSMLTLASNSPSLNSSGGLLNVVNSGTAKSGVVARIQSNSTAGSGLTVLANGAVGIGNAAPAVQLDVNGSIRGGDILTLNGYVFRSEGSAYLEATSNGFISLRPSGPLSEAVRITANGNVGVGTQTPAAVLDLTSTGTNSALILPRDTTANRPGLNVANGMVRYNTSTNKFEAYENGAWINMIGGSAATASNVALSGLTAATATNTIDSLNFGQTWNWSSATTQTPLAISANALTTGSLLKLSTSSTSLSSTGGLLIVANTGTATSGTVARIQSNSSSVSGLTVNADGRVGIGTTTPSMSLDIQGGSSTLGSNGIRILSTDAAGGNNALIEVTGKRYDGNNMGTFSGTIALSRNRTDSALTNQNQLGRVMFGGNHTDGSLANVLYTSSIGAVAEGTFSNSTTMPTGLAFYTGANGYTTSQTASWVGAERMRIDTNGNVGIGTSAPSSALQVVGQVTASTAVVAQGAGSTTAYSATSSSVAVPDSIDLTASNTFAGDSRLAALNLTALNSASTSQSAYLGAVSNNAGSTPSIVIGQQTGATAYRERLRIDANGNLGLGTSTPVVALDVTGTGSFSAVVLPRDTTANRPSANVANGMIRYNTTTNKFEAYENGAWTNVIGGAAANVSLSGITAATTANTIDNLNNAQTWNWSTATTQDPLSIGANALTTGSILTLSSSSPSLNSTDGLLTVANTGTATSGVVARIQSNSTTGSGLTVLANGNVGVGISNPTSNFQVYSATVGASTSATISAVSTNVSEKYTAAGSGRYQGETFRVQLDQNGFDNINAAGGVLGSRITAGTTGSSGTISSVYGVVAGGGNGTAGGTISNFTNFYAEPPATTGTVTNVYGFAAGNPESGAALNFSTPVNTYGFWSKVNAGPTNYGFYSAGSAQSYFRGNVGIGATVPAAALDVSVTGSNSAVILPRDTTANRPGLNVANGMIRYNTSTNKFEAYENGAWINMIGGSAATATNVALSGLTAASATNTIDNLNFGQTWNWSTATTQTPLSVNADALTTGSMLSLASGNPSLNSTSGLLSVINSGTATSGVVARIQSNSSSGSGITVLANGRVNVGSTSSPGAMAVSTTDTNAGFYLFGAPTAGYTNSSLLLANMTSGSYSSMVQTGDMGLIFRGSAIDTAKGFVIAPWSTGGSGIRLDSVGRVGIGQSNPVAALDVAATGTNSAILVPRDTTANRPGLNVANGMVRYNTTTNKFEAYENGAWITMIGGAAANVSLSGISTATAVNTIDNLNFAQTWNWSNATTQTPLAISANAITTGSLLNLTTSSASLSSTNGLLNVANTGTATSGTVARIQSNSTAGSGLTVLANGNVGIGSATPAYPLTIANQTVGATALGAAVFAVNSLVSEQLTAANSGRYHGHILQARLDQNGFTTTSANGALVGASSNASTTGSSGTAETVYSFVAAGGNLTSGGTINHFVDYMANPPMTVGTVTNVYGFAAGNPSSGAPLNFNTPVNTYGFWSKVSAGASNYSVYASGGAQSYFAGNVGIGSLTPNSILDVAATGTNSAITLPRDTTANRPAGNVANGMIRYNTTLNKFEAYENGAWTNVIGGTASNTPLSGLTAATGTNTIDNLNSAQNWNWSSATTQSPLSLSANALTTGSLLSVTSSNGSLNSTSGLLNVANTNASSSGILARFQSNSNVGSGLTVLTNGRVGIGNASPSFLLDVVGDTARIVTRAVSDTSNVTIEAQANDYNSGPTYSSTALVEYGTAASSTIAGVTTANLGVLRFQNNKNALIYTNGGTPIIFATASVENMRIAPNGNVGIGTTSPQAKLDVRGELKLVNTDWVSGSTGSGLNILTGATSGNTYTGIQAYTAGASGAGDLILQNGGGRLGIGTTGPVGKVEINGGNAGTLVGVIINTATTGANTYEQYKANGTVIGSITSAAGANVAFNTTSDVRLKGGFTPVVSPLEKVNAIEVANFYYLKDPAQTRMDGFKAQQLFEVVPYAVTKPAKDVEDDGTVNPWQADYSKVVPLLTAALQELFRKVVGLEDHQAIQDRQLASIKERETDKDLRIKNLERENAEMKARLDKIESMLNSNK